MKKFVVLTCMAAIGASAMAQDTFSNNEFVNNAGDVHGTARFVGMGGAMGALGADISVMGWNPAGIGLMRRSTFSLTSGAAWSQKGIEEKGTTNATLDQMGFVYNLELDDPDVPYINIGLNYQKKRDFNGAFYADNMNLAGLSQMSQLAGIANAGFDTGDNLAGMAVDNGFLTAFDANGNAIEASDKTPIHHFGNNFKGTSNFYTQYSSGYLSEFDINISSNIQDRYYWGITFSIENLRYRGFADYFEKSVNPQTKNAGDYSVYNDHAIDGVGFNLKVGGIVRPFEDSPLRIALVAEIPTWYQLKKSTFFNMTDNVDKFRTHDIESYLEYSIRTPFKFRAGVGSTVSNFLAWDVDYEFANYRSTAMGYPDTYVDDPSSSIFNNTWDKAMNENTKRNLKPVHNVRAGLEFKPDPAVAFRVGYNYATTACKDNVSFNQVDLDSYAMDYATSTSFMRLGDVHSVNLGVGFNWKYAFLDFAYKLKSQKADFYAFDSNDQGGKLDPVNVDLTRHQITATLGFKF